MGTTLAKATPGYGYKYTELCDINKHLDSEGIRYYQYIEPDANGNDYVFTVPIIDGKEQKPRRGCRVVMATLNGKSNPAQEQGSAITYARRYSLLMAFGLATEDDDAACLTEDKKKPKKSEGISGYPSREVMMEVIKKRFPEGSQNADLLLKSNNLNSMDEMTDAQVATVYNRVGGR